MKKLIKITDLQSIRKFDFTRKIANLGINHFELNELIDNNINNIESVIRTQLDKLMFKDLNTTLERVISQQMEFIEFKDLIKSGNAYCIEGLRFGGFVYQVYNNDEIVYRFEKKIDLESFYGLESIFNSLNDYEIISNSFVYKGRFKLNFRLGEYNQPQKHNLDISTDFGIFHLAVFVDLLNETFELINEENILRIDDKLKTYNELIEKIDIEVNTFAKKKESIRKTFIGDYAASINFKSWFPAYSDLIDIVNENSKKDIKDMIFTNELDIQFDIKFGDDSYITLEIVDNEIVISSRKKVGEKLAKKCIQWAIANYDNIMYLYDFTQPIKNDQLLIGLK